MTQNQIRTKIQSEAVKLSKSNQHLCLEWSTGCGKTLASVKIIEEILKANPNAKGYLICKETTHKANWINDINKHKKSHILKNINVFLYASLKNQKNKVDFVVLDECHALTPKRISYLIRILRRDTKLIFLSATIPDEKKYAIMRLCTNVHFYKIPLIKAIEMGLLPEPELVVHRVTLNSNLGPKPWNYKFRLKTKGSNITKHCTRDMLSTVIRNSDKEDGITVRCTEKEYYDLVTQQMNYYKALSENITASVRTRDAANNKFLNLGSVRKKFIAEVKTERVKHIVKEFRKNKSRFICFTGSIDQVKEIGASSAVHSHNTKEKNQELVDCFNDQSCSELFSVKMLRESINLTNVEKGIITQLDSSIGSFFQMLGRCLRHEFPEMHLLVLDGTQDVAYFKKSMDSFDKKYVRLC